ncbi:MAG: TetR/AcrR family transcriptional regulator [Clostridiaceae bacterium]|nr:TetR/AcrR family transcriptional regulator [Clostridiaceae bacterium]
MSRKFDYSALLGEGNPLLRYPNLMEAAIDEFSMKKFDEASLNDILKNAGMSKGSLYHNFGDKFGLYLALMDMLIKKKLSFFYPAMRQKIDISRDFFGSLKEIIKNTTDFMLAEERMHHLMNRVLEESEEFRNRLYNYFPFVYTQSFIAYIREAVKTGQIDSRYPPELVANILEILFSNIHKLVSTKDPDEIIKTINMVVDILQYGIASKQ